MSTIAAVAFGQRLRELRAEHGVSQDTLARATGIHPTAIGRFERGDREPRLTSILRIAHGLGMPPGALLDDLERIRPTRCRLISQGLGLDDEDFRP
jgi:transcriptional regulator with XRE-family HTH domain